MEIERARYLVSDVGREALEAVATLPATDPLRLSAELRKRFGAEEAAALGEQLVLRARAAARFQGEWPGLLFTGPGLEMMTHPRVARRRATRLARLGRAVHDLTCGLGGDLLACREAGLSYSGVERDAATALLAAANLGSDAVIQGEAASHLLDHPDAAILLDPSRREGFTRRFDPASFSPPWDACMAWAAAASAAVVKGPPGIDRRHLPPEAEIEFVQVGRSLRECTAWFGEATSPGLARAVYLPSAGGEVTLDSTAPEAPAPAADIGSVFYDPQSCVTTAGLVRHLAHELGARLLDPHIAYLTAPYCVFHALAEPFEVLATLPFSLNRLRAHLRAAGFRPGEIRRRAFPVEPEALRTLLGRLQGDPVTVFCTTIAGQKTIILGRPASRPSV